MPVSTLASKYSTSALDDLAEELVNETMLTKDTLALLPSANGHHRRASTEGGSAVGSRFSSSSSRAFSLSKIFRRQSSGAENRDAPEGFSGKNVGFEAAPSYGSDVVNSFQEELQAHEERREENRDEGQGASTSDGRDQPPTVSAASKKSRSWVLNAMKNRRSRSAIRSPPSLNDNTVAVSAAQAYANRRLSRSLSGERAATPYSPRVQQPQQARMEQAHDPSKSSNHTRSRKIWSNRLKSASTSSPVTTRKPPDTNEGTSKHIGSTSSRARALRNARSHVRKQREDIMAPLIQNDGTKERMENMVSPMSSVNDPNAASQEHGKPVSPHKESVTREEVARSFGSRARTKALQRAKNRRAIHSLSPPRVLLESPQSSSSSARSSPVSKTPESSRSLQSSPVYSSSGIQFSYESVKRIVQKEKSPSPAGTPPAGSATTPRQASLSPSPSRPPRSPLVRRSPVSARISSIRSPSSERRKARTSPPDMPKPSSGMVPSPRKSPSTSTGLPLRVETSQLSDEERDDKDEIEHTGSTLVPSKESEPEEVAAIEITKSDLITSTFENMKMPPPNVQTNSPPSQPMKIPALTEQTRSNVKSSPRNIENDSPTSPSRSRRPLQRMHSPRLSSRIAFFQTLHESNLSAKGTLQQNKKTIEPLPSQQFDERSDPAFSEAQASFAGSNSPSGKRNADGGEIEDAGQPSPSMGINMFGSDSAFESVSQGQLPHLASLRKIEEPLGASQIPLVETEPTPPIVPTPVDDTEACDSQPSGGTPTVSFASRVSMFEVLAGTEEPIAAKINCTLKLSAEKETIQPDAFLSGLENFEIENKISSVVPTGPDARDGDDKKPNNISQGASVEGTPASSFASRRSLFESTAPIEKSRRKIRKPSIAKEEPVNRGESTLSVNQKSLLSGSLKSVLPEESSEGTFTSRRSLFEAKSKASMKKSQKPWTRKHAERNSVDFGRPIRSSNKDVQSITSVVSRDKITLECDESDTCESKMSGGKRQDEGGLADGTLAEERPSPPIAQSSPRHQGIAARLNFFEFQKSREEVSNQTNASRNFPQTRRPKLVNPSVDLDLQKEEKAISVSDTKIRHSGESNEPLTIPRVSITKETSQGTVCTDNTAAESTKHAFSSQNRLKHGRKKSMTLNSESVSFLGKPESTTQASPSPRYVPRRKGGLLSKISMFENPKSRSVAPMNCLDDVEQLPRATCAIRGEETKRNEEDIAASALGNIRQRDAQSGSEVQDSESAAGAEKDSQHSAGMDNHAMTYSTNHQEDKQHSRNASHSSSKIRSSTSQKNLAPPKKANDRSKSSPVDFPEELRKAKGPATPTAIQRDSMVEAKISTHLKEAKLGDNSIEPGSGSLNQDSNDSSLPVLPLPRQTRVETATGEQKSERGTKHGLRQARLTQAHDQVNASETDQLSSERKQFGHCGTRSPAFAERLSFFQNRRSAFAKAERSHEQREARGTRPDADSTDVERQGKNPVHKTSVESSPINGTAHDISLTENAGSESSEDSRTSSARSNIAAPKVEVNGDTNHASTSLNQTASYSFASGDVEHNEDKPPLGDCRVTPVPVVYKPNPENQSPMFNGTKTMFESKQGKRKTGSELLASKASYKPVDSEQSSAYTAIRHMFEDNPQERRETRSGARNSGLPANPSPRRKHPWQHHLDPQSTFGREKKPLRLSRVEEHKRPTQKSDEDLLKTDDDDGWVPTAPWGSTNLLDLARDTPSPHFELDNPALPSEICWSDDKSIAASSLGENMHQSFHVVVAPTNYLESTD